MKRFAAIIAAVVLLSGCGVSDETYQPEKYVDIPDKVQSSSPITAPSASKSAAVSSAAHVPVSEVSQIKDGYAEESGIRELKTTPTTERNELAFTIENLFSEGEYYTLIISGTKTDSAGKGTVAVNGEYYGDVALTLFKDGQQIDRFAADIPDGERLMILESAAEDLSYGCEVISNLREFGADEYPDFLELVLRGGSNEAAVPEYARFFTIFNGKIAELPVYENGAKTAPRGAKLEPRGAGLAAQYLTVLKNNGLEEYEIIKYEYRFDLENKRLNKQQVRFYGFAY